MPQLSIPYQLIGPDGTRVVFGNCEEAIEDPDFVAFLDPDNGITGLLDGADVREQAGDLVEADGGWHGPFFEGRRPGTIQGVLLPNGDIGDVVAAERRLKAATRALRQDAVLRWTPAGETIERELRVRRQSPVRVTGRWPKAFQVALVSAEPHVLSSSEASISCAAEDTVALVGFTSPVTSPLRTTVTAVGGTSVVNAGDLPSWPRFTIHGPITNPQISNFSTGLSIRFSADLAPDQFLVVDSRYATVQLGNDAGGALANRYSFYDFAASEWWQLLPGTNDVRLIASAWATGNLLTCYWRHAWE